MQHQLLVAGGLALLASGAAAMQTPGPALAPGAQRPHKQAAGIGDAADLIPEVALDKQVGMPDKWWQYKDRAGKPTAFVAEQNWFVSIGGELLVNSGAVVRYRALLCKSAAKAKEAFKRQLDTPGRKGAVTTTVSAFKAGNEAQASRELAIKPNGRPDWLRQQTVARFGLGVVTITAHSNMWAFGPRPPSGQRRWMAEAVYERVREEAFKRWSLYRPSSAAPTGKPTKAPAPTQPRRQ